MKTTKVIDSAGESLYIPIDENDQTVGLTIVGEFSGVLQIVGMVTLEGREFELFVYNPDGTIGSLEDEPPLDLFLDVGGFTQVKVMGVLWTSGIATITAITSSAKRIRITGSQEGVGQEVQVTNFPQVQNVAGPLTNGQLRNHPVVTEDNHTQQLLSRLIGIDSDGNPLPIHFDSYGSSFTYNGELIQTEQRVVEDDTYTRTYSYNGEQVVSSSAWVKS